MKLLVYVPGLGSKRRRYAELLRLLADELGAGWRVEVFEHRLQPWSIEPMGDAAHRLAVQVRTWAGDNGAAGPVEEVLLVGHSIGGLLVRHAYLLDAGHTDERGRGTYAWTGKVRRIVLLAAPNAGFRTARMPRWRRAAFAVAAVWRQFTVEELQAGSPYITELRLRWVHAFRTMLTRPSVVQVLGDSDALVARGDSLDVEYMANATRIDVPGATHGSLVDVTSAADPGERWAVLRRAVFENLDDGLNEVYPTGKPVYFLLHGIRAGRYANWVGQLTRQLTEPEPDAVVYSPSYGYLTAVEFAIPFTRSRNLRRFLDWYSWLYVTHGPEHLRFAGHSNGTYLIGQALRRVPAMRFERVYLAGSVLPREYPWSSVVDQVTGVVHSDRATADWPVGWLCSALRGLGMRDVGTGGFTGFDQVSTKLVEHDQAVAGGHGAALIGEQRLAEVAAFLRDGASDGEPAAAPKTWFAVVSRVAGVIAKPLLIGAVMAAAVWVATADTWTERAVRAGALLLAGFALLAVGRAV